MKPEGEGEIKAKEAARILDVTNIEMNNLANRGRLTRWQACPGKKGSDSYFREAEVRALATLPTFQRRRISRQQQKAYQHTTAQCQRPDRTALITCREAARLLGISCSEVAHLVNKRRLFSYQTKSGQQGARHLLIRAQVEWFGDSPERIKRLRAYFKSFPHQERTPEKIDPDSLPEWLLTEDVMRLLGVAESAVCLLRRRGILRVRRLKQGGYGRLYLHWKADVLARLADPVYQELCARWFKGQVTKFQRAMKMVYDVNGWDRPDHTPDYCPAPGHIW